MNRFGENGWATLEDFACEMRVNKYLDGLNLIKLGCRLKNRRLPGADHSVRLSKYMGKGGGGASRLGVGGWGLGVGLHSVLSTIFGANFFQNFYNEAAQNQPSTLNPQPSTLNPLCMLSPNQNLVS